MGKYQESMQYIGEGPEISEGPDISVGNKEEVDPLAEASEQDSNISMADINWEIPDEVMNEAYAEAYEQKEQAASANIWIAEHPIEAIKMLATHLDAMAENYQESQAGRYTRIVATEAHKLHWLLMGSDEAISELNEVPGW